MPAGKLSAGGTVTARIYVTHDRILVPGPSSFRIREAVESQFRTQAGGCIAGTSMNVFTVDGGS